MFLASSIFITCDNDYKGSDWKTVQADLVQSRKSRKAFLAMALTNAGGMSRSRENV